MASLFQELLLLRVFFAVTTAILREQLALTPASLEFVSFEKDADLARFAGATSPMI